MSIAIKRVWSTMSEIKVNPNCVTTFESYSLEYEWKISNVKYRLSKPGPLHCPEEVKSPPGNLPATTWRLEALGKGTHGYNLSKEPNCWTVTLVLTSSSSSSETWVRVDMGVKVRSFYSDPKRKIIMKSLNVSPYCPNPQTVRMSCCSYFTGYIPINELCTYQNGDDLILHYHIYVYQLEKPTHSVTVAQVKAPEFDISKVLEDARHNDRYTDVTLVTEGKEFKAHRLVLASQSPFFETRLEKRWTDQGGTKIEMTDVSADIMDAILAYMYTGKVVNIDKTAYNLLPKAEQYQLEGLKVTCEEVLSKTLTAQTVIDYLILADTHNAQNLRQSCLSFIAGNITEVKKSSDWSAEKIKLGPNKNLWTEVLEYIVKSL